MTSLAFTVPILLVFFYLAILVLCVYIFYRLIRMAINKELEINRKEIGQYNHAMFEELREIKELLIEKEKRD